MHQYAFLAPDPPLAPYRARITRRGRARALGLRRARRMVIRRLIVLAAALVVPALAAPGDILAERQAIAAPMGPATIDWLPGAPMPAMGAAREPAGPAAAAVPHAARFPVPADPGPAARPLVVRAPAADLARARHCLAQAIYYEAASESEAGQRAVAQVVLNRVAHPSWPDSVCGVVFEGAERETGCQFTFTCDGSLARRPHPAFWARAQRIASAALAGAVFAPAGLATHYHTTAVYPHWAPSLKPLARIGAHRFYRPVGRFGGPDAFHARHAGREPELAMAAMARHNPSPAVLAAGPAPSGSHGSAAPMAAAPAAAPATEPGSPAPVAAPVASPVAAMVAPAHGPPGASANGAAAISGQIRHEYARSGRWLAQSPLPPRSRPPTSASR